MVLDGLNTRNSSEASSIGKLRLIKQRYGVPQIFRSRSVDTISLLFNCPFSTSQRFGSKRPETKRLSQGPILGPLLYIVCKILSVSFNDTILHIVVGTVVGKLSLKLNYKTQPPAVSCKLRVKLLFCMFNFSTLVLSFESLYHFTVISLYSEHLC